MIEIEDLEKSFKETKALNGASFRAERGKITGLLGPNGAGKSTCLRILYTVMKPDRGVARVDGIDVARDAQRARRRLGVLPHGSGLYGHLTARENIRYHGALHGLRRSSIAARIDRLRQVLDLDELLDRPCKGFSQGQKARVALARALIHDPSHVVLDEPSSGLDVMATRRFRDWIRTLRDEGRCVLFSTHLMQEVTAVCDEVVIIAGGRVRAQASLEALPGLTGHANLEDAFVALTRPEGLS
jgi:sodium transport system ATP-binding protein